MTTSSSAAPGRLETVRRFVNTVDIDAHADSLTTPDDLRRWLRAAEMLDARAEPTPVHLRRAIALREALRSAMLANHSRGSMPADAVAVLNDVAERAQIALSFTPNSLWAAQPRASGVDGALGSLLVIVADAMAIGTWDRLKACVNDTCRWAFYDHSRARSGKWCSMQVCGNRAKQQAWRQRR